MLKRHASTRARHNAIKSCVTSLTLGVQGGLASLVLSDLHHHVLLAPLAECTLCLWDVHLDNKRSEQVPFSKLATIPALPDAIRKLAQHIRNTVSEYMNVASSAGKAHVTDKRAKLRTAGPNCERHYDSPFFLPFPRLKRPAAREGSLLVRPPALKQNACVLNDELCSTHVSQYTQPQPFCRFSFIQGPPM